VNESLIALKDCKRVVELRYKNILSEKSDLDQKLESITQQSELLQVKNQSLEERMSQLEKEKLEQTDILAQIQENLIKKTSEYESQIQSMQIELDTRLDEINVNQKENACKVKEHYIELFEEKASEVMNLRSELEKRDELVKEYKSKCTDLEYREEELNDLVNKMRTDPSMFDQQDTKNQLEATLTQTVILQNKLDILKTGFEEMKKRENNRIEQFDKSVENLQSIISNKDKEILNLTKNLTKEPDIPVFKEHKNFTLKEPNISSLENSIIMDQNTLLNSDTGIDTAVTNKIKPKSKRKKKKTHI